MPELPEVETVRRDLSRTLVGARIEALWTSGKPLRLGRALDVRGLEGASVGRAVRAVRRRAKYLLIDTDGDTAVVVHLGMSGRLLVAPARDPRPLHTHVVWALADGRELRFTDPRRFGQVAIVRHGEERALPELAVLGIDPLADELTTEELAELARGSRRPAKAFLLDQRLVAGLGNIYVCEALWEAGIHPATRMGRIGRTRLSRLRDAIVAVLERGVANRGTSFRDYVDGSGQKGDNQHALRVYGREGEPCPRCSGGIIRRVTQARSTFYCARCQRR